MTAELQQLQHQLNAALSRIQHLEERLSRIEEATRYSHLVARPHPWRRQLSLKDRNMTVGQLVSVLRANNLTPEKASEDLELPLAAVLEALAYFEQHRELIDREAAEERRYLEQRGYSLEPQNLPR
jgi:hypothetical protein